PSTSYVAAISPHAAASMAQAAFSLPVSPYSRAAWTRLPRASVTVMRRGCASRAGREKRSVSGIGLASRQGQRPQRDLAEPPGHPLGHDPVTRTRPRPVGERPRRPVLRDLGELVLGPVVVDQEAARLLRLLPESSEGGRADPLADEVRELRRDEVDNLGVAPRALV